MKIYDITQGVFASEVYPGDPVPKKRRIMSFDKDEPDVCQLTSLFLGSHTGTHIDAPSHFIKGGKTIDQIDLLKTYGECVVVSMEGTIHVEDISGFIKDDDKKILIKGDVIFGLEVAKFFSEKKIDLIGVESISVGSFSQQREVHMELLKNEIIIVEGLKLSDVEDGRYIFSGQPLNLEGVDGSPIRAILIDAI